MNHTVGVLLLGGCCVAGLALVPLGLPGLWLMLAAVVGYGWLTGFHAIGLVTIAVVLGLALLGELFELWLGYGLARRYGGSPRAGWGALLGGLAGAVIGVPVPLVGSVIGADGGPRRLGRPGGAPGGGDGQSHRRDRDGRGRPRRRTARVSTTRWSSTNLVDSLRHRLLHEPAHACQTPETQDCGSRPRAARPRTRAAARRPRAPRIQGRHRRLAGRPARSQARGAAVHPLAPARAHPNLAVGHRRVHAERQTRFARMAGGLLAARGRAARRRRVGQERRPGGARSSDHGATGDGRQDGSVRPHSARHRTNRAARSAAARRPQLLPRGAAGPAATPARPVSGRRSLEHGQDAPRLSVPAN